MQATVASTQRLVDLMAVIWADLTRRSTPELFHVLGRLDVSFSQVKMLFRLGETGELSVGDLAGALGLSLPAASRAVDGLAQRGLVTRREHAEDRRSKLVGLTPQGRATVDEVLSARLQTLDEFAAELPEAEREALAAALAPIAGRISP
jgi:DNA-binding MarR family transcriptional regulator